MFGQYLKKVSLNEKSRFATRCLVLTERRKNILKTQLYNVYFENIQNYN